MTIAQREQQIYRVRESSFQPELDETLERALRSAVVAAVKTTLEAALEAEVKAELGKMTGERPRRSGYFGVAVPTGGKCTLTRNLKLEAA
jgi:transposase-like protein